MLLKGTITLRSIASFIQHAKDYKWVKFRVFNPKPTILSQIRQTTRVSANTGLTALPFGFSM